MKTINLKFNKMITSLAGNAYGKSIFKEQCEDIDYKSGIEIIFPDQIKYIATSFIQGFFQEIVENIGIVGIMQNVEIKSNTITNLKKFVTDCLN